jgi:hypothetical protein
MTRFDSRGNADPYLYNPHTVLKSVSPEFVGDAGAIISNPLSRFVRCPPALELTLADTDCPADMDIGAFMNSLWGPDVDYSRGTKKRKLTHQSSPTSVTTVAAGSV